MARIGLLALVAALALLTVTSGGRDVEAGALPSNIPGDANCSGKADAVDALYNMLYEQNIQTGLACQTNGNVNCDDQINMDDTIAIVKYAAGVGQELPNGCPPIGVDAVHSTVDKGTDTIHGTWSFSLDQGTEVQSSGDLYWSIDSNTPLVARLHAASGIARITSSLPFSNISYSQLVGGEYGPGPIESTELHVGDVFAVKTYGGNYAKVKIVTLDYNMEILWVTFSPDPPAP